MKGYVFTKDTEAYTDTENHLANVVTDGEIEKFDGDLKAFLLMIQDKFDEQKLKTVIAAHRETWYAISAIKKDKRYIDYIDSISDEELAGGVYMDAVLDRIETRGEAKVNELGIRMKEAGRVDEFLESLTDSELQRKLFIEFEITKETR